MKKPAARHSFQALRGSATETPIHFGTDGWRGRLEQDFNLENVTRVARALVRYLVDFEDLRQGVLVAYDTRLGADRFALRVAEVLTSVGTKVGLAQEPTPTPALSFAVHHLGAAAGIMLTASHNPPEWLGIKLKSRCGGSASSRATAEIELNLRDHRRLPQVQPITRAIQRIDFKPSYLDRLAQLADLDRIARAQLRFVVDPMHGAGAGYLTELLAGRNIEVAEIRGRRDPQFGGMQPEPTEANLTPLVEAVRHAQAAAGFATDGDADRLAAVDHIGQFVDPHKIFCLLFRHLVERRGLRGGVAKTFSVSKMVDCMAERYRLALHETPIGFKHIAELMLEQDLLIGGEESGGIGIRPHLPERDGILNSLLLAEILATESKPLADCVAELHREFGPHHYRRIDLSLEPRQKHRAVQYVSRPTLTRIGDWNVSGREDLDGTKLYLALETTPVTPSGSRGVGQSAWVLVRASGTEPLVRVYAEAPEAVLAERIAASVAALLRSV